MPMAYPMNLLVALLACQPPPTDPDPGPTADSSTTEPVTSVHCDVSADNALRGLCQVFVDPPAALEVTYGPEHAAVARRVASSLEVRATHEIVLPMLPPTTTVVWSARALGDERSWAGTFDTREVPADVAVQVAIKGRSTATLMGFASPCIRGAVAFVVDSQTGAPLWYHDFVGGRGALRAVSFTDRGTVLGMTDRGVQEVDLAGNVLLDLARTPTGTELHHDVLRHGDLVYVLYRREVTVEGQPYDLDGYFVFDDQGDIVHDWFLGDHHTPSGATDVSTVDDYSHANSLFVDVDGDVVISFRHLSSVIKVAGIEAVDAGTVRWVWSGQPDGALGNDITTVNETGGAEGFAGQHHVFRRPDGRWAMFDNREEGHVSSRVLIATLDESAGTAALQEAYDVGNHCPFQGSAGHTEAGNPIATCAPYRTALEFVAGSHGSDGEPEEPRWTGTATCSMVNIPLVPRFIPLEW